VENEFFFREIALVFGINKYFFRVLASELRMFTKGMFLHKYSVMFETFTK